MPTEGITSALVTLIVTGAEVSVRPALSWATAESEYVPAVTLLHVRYNELPWVRLVCTTPVPFVASPMVDAPE